MSKSQSKKYQTAVFNRSVLQPASLQRQAAVFVVTVFLLLQHLLIIAPNIGGSGKVYAAPSTDIVISQVYGGGGNAGATYKNDFIELFNRGASAVTVAGWSVQYASASGTAWSKTDLTGTIQPGRYYLVQESAGSGGSISLPTPDASGSIAMSATAGKIALVTNGTLLTCGTANNCLPNAAIKDLVGFGTGASGANSFEGTGPTATLSNTTAAIRAGNGCTDSDNNGADFNVAAPTPRNSTSPTGSCGVTNNPPTITNPANPITTVNQNAIPFTVSLSGSDDNGIYNWSATVGTGVSSVSVTAGQGTTNVTYNVSLQSGFSGTATFTASLSDNVNPAVTRAVNIAVTPAAPNNPPALVAFSNPVTTVAQDAAPFNLSFSGTDDNNAFNWSATTGTGVSGVTVNAGQGTANVTYAVTLQPGFSGTASFTASLSDNVNALVSRSVMIAVTPAPPPPLDHVVISQVYGGGGNSGAAFQNDFVELFNPDTISHDLSGWTIQYGAATGSSWQVQPLGGAIAPGEYYLIKLATNGAVGSVVPEANINGTLNLSGSNGKVALVRNGDALDGCVAGDPIVDLVGYGTTANCREGATNAPTLSNTTSAFRKNGGFADTNVNGADFVIAAPNPRRTTPIVELPPTTLSSDPRNSGTNAPRDASITVTFTEPVDVADGWFSINCATTGLHNSATVAPAGANAWIIIPNVNFQPGEQCALTVNKEFVNDSDLDDALPNTDKLTSNYSATFTVSSGATPAYPKEVHLTFGNPSGATADVNEPNNYLMEKPEFTLSYNRDRGTPNWVSWHLADEWIGSLARIDTFRADPSVPADWYRVTHVDYSASGFDRGHMVPNADRDPETSTPINQATFLMTNMIPQAPDNNQGPWANLEGYLRTLLPANELYIVAGGAGTGGIGSNGLATSIANGKVTVPAKTWKVALVIPKSDGDDVSRVNCGTRTIAVIMPNEQGIRGNDWQSYITTVDAVEQLTGYDFFSNLPDHIETCVEAGVNGVNPPGAEDQSVTTDENAAKQITLTAAASNTDPLTFTILSQPTNGVLTGSGAERTYTPNPSFIGTDSFTFRVSQGAKNSNVATVSIAVLEINDAPVAASDAKTTDEDVQLNFAAGELTQNDSAGTDENAQVLIVTEVIGGPVTHGEVTLNGGQVSYQPELNFNGAAAFQYKVCDNGQTRGTSDSKCALGTVSITINPVNDQPTATDDSADTKEDAAVTIDVLANDSDIDADTLSLSAVTDGAHGTVTISNNQAVYMPAANYYGSDSFSYTAADGNGGSRTANVSVAIASINDNPVAAADQATVNEDSSDNAINVLANDNTGPDTGETLTVAGIETPAQHGTVSFTASGVSYTPSPNYNGEDSFAYKISDGNGGSASEVVSITVRPVNDAPVIATIANKTTDELTLFSFAVSATDVDAGDTISYTLVSAPVGATIDPATGVIRWTPTEEQGTGAPYFFTVRATDSATPSLSDEKQFTVTVNEVNQAPVLAPIGNKTVFLGNALSFTAPAADADVPAQTLSFSLSGAAPAGASINPATGAFSWTPNSSQFGQAYSITVQVTDSGNLSDQKTFTVTIGDNVAPEITINSPFDGARFALNQTVLAGYSCSDSGSGIGSCTAAVTNGAAIDTSSVGAKTFTVTAVDRAGNRFSKTVNYTVSFNVVALFDQTKQNNSGSAIWIKLKIVDAGGVNRSAANVQLTAVRVEPGNLPAQSSGNSNPSNTFSFDSASQSYQYNLKSEKTWAAGTYQLIFRVAGDPLERSVSFNIR